MIASPSAPSRFRNVSAFFQPLTLLTVLIAGLASSGCENKAIGRVCDVQADGGVNQYLVNGQALECPSRLCVRAAKDDSVAKAVDTTALCTAECSSDSDCSDGETRTKGNPKDRRCESGFVCGVGPVTGPVCCKKICICKDFIDIPPTGLQTPAYCKSAASTCVNSK